MVLPTFIFSIMLIKRSLDFLCLTRLHDHVLVKGYVWRLRRRMKSQRKSVPLSWRGTLYITGSFRYFETKYIQMFVTFVMNDDLHL